MEATTQMTLFNTTGIGNDSRIVEHSGIGDEIQSHKHYLYGTFSVLTYIAAAIAIFGILLTLFSYIGYRKFRVKRTHIIIVNLCFCLLLYFIAYVISNSERKYFHSGQTAHDACIAGAFLCHFAVLCAWFWIGSYWVLLLVMFRRPSGGHISNFFLKTALPSYGIPLLGSVIAILVAYSKGDIHDDEHHYFSESCFVSHGYLFIGIIIPFGIVLLPVLIIFFCVLIGMVKSNLSEREERNKQRIKGHLIKLSIITLFLALVMISTMIIPAVKPGFEVSSSTAWVVVVCFTVGAIAMGTLLMYMFCIHQKEIRHHWIGVVSGKGTSLNGRSVRPDFGSRKSSMANSRQPMIYVDEPLEEPNKKFSTIRIVPKDDTDMTSLGLVTIPGTPSPYHQEIINTDETKKTPSEERGELDRKESTLSNNNEKKRSSKALGKDTSKNKKETAPSSAHAGKLYGAKKMMSVDKIIPRSFQRDGKRRSFSTSSIRPNNDTQLSIAKRQSNLSAESAKMTNFD